MLDFSHSKKKNLVIIRLNELILNCNILFLIALFIKPVSLWKS